MYHVADRGAALPRLHCSACAECSWSTTRHLYQPPETGLLSIQVSTQPSETGLLSIQVSNQPSETGLLSIQVSNQPSETGLLSI
jgi:hypothetical protein